MRVRSAAAKMRVNYMDPADIVRVNAKIRRCEENRIQREKHNSRYLTRAFHPGRKDSIFFFAKDVCVESYAAKSAADGNLAA